MAKLINRKNETKRKYAMIGFGLGILGGLGIWGMNGGMEYTRQRPTEVVVEKLYASSKGTYRATFHPTSNPDVILGKEIRRSEFDKLNPGEKWVTPVTPMAVDGLMGLRIFLKVFSVLILGAGILTLIAALSE